MALDGRYPHLGPLHTFPGLFHRSGMVYVLGTSTAGDRRHNPMHDHL